MVKMKYPYDSNNINYDGKEHNIQPKCLVEYKNEIYLLYYYDMSLGKDMNTFLIKDKSGDFFKVPLDSYDTREVKEVIAELLHKMTVDKDAVLAAQNLPDKINCTPFHTFSELIGGKVTLFDNSKTNSDVITPIFHNLFDSKYYCDPECTMLIDDISALGVMGSRNKSVIIDDIGHVYNIMDVYVDKDKSLVVKPIFHNLADGKYYFDSECIMSIDDISVLGNIDKKKNIIIQSDIVYKLLDINIRNNYNNHDKQR